MWKGALVWQAVRVRISIVGAGIAGLAGARALAAAGHAIEVFDRTPDVGGVWSATRRYPGLRTQNSKRAYSFSELPMPASYPDVPSGSQMQAYLQSYVERFGLGNRVRLNTEVTTARPIAGGWSLQVRELSQQRIETVVCDHLVVANGVFSDPALPRYPGADVFIDAGGGCAMRRSSATFARLRASMSWWSAMASLPATSPRP
jgi:cation diffusion facilitator CzcD-associated flavoprotein CzcO